MAKARLPREVVETREFLSERLTYDPDTGVLRWRILWPGRVAGAKLPAGYLKLVIDRRDYKAHRLAWILHHGGTIPDGWHIDHINGDPSDNRMANLRLCSPKANQENSRKPKNNTTGFKGVSRVLRKFRAQIGHNGRQVYIGTFDTPQEAHAAYVATAEKLGWEVHRAN